MIIFCSQLTWYFYLPLSPLPNLIIPINIYTTTTTVPSASLTHILLDYISVSQVSQHSSVSEQINDADFQSAASSPSQFSQPSTLTNNSMAKIIDIQKTKCYKRNGRHHESQQTTIGQEEEEESRLNR